MRKVSLTYNRKVINEPGEARVLRFRNIADPGILLDYELETGSLVYMTQEVQREWQHAIPKKDTDKGRISLTLRRMK